MNTEQLDIWTSSFGADYTDRNDQEIPARRKSWERMLSGIKTESILEVGCNVGWNLTYLSALGRRGLAGVEPQPYALARAKQRLAQCQLSEGSAFALPSPDRSFDLVFTSGVLIHIHAADLRRALAEMYRVSRRYILYIEYDAQSEQAIGYHGESNALWKRDHCAAWLSAYPELRIIKKGHWAASAGYDDCTWCLFEKPEHAAQTE